MYILASIAAFFGLFGLYVASRPSAFRIARSRTINATPAVLFGLINDFHEWAHWSPWEKMDPSMNKTYEGPSSGKGAIYRWKGNNKVGEGMMTILDTTPDSRLEIQLQFIKPFAATNKAIFTLEPDGGATKVTWATEGQNNFGAKAFGVFVNMDDLLGKDFSSGLEGLETAAAKKRA